MREDLPPMEKHQDTVLGSTGETGASVDKIVSKEEEKKESPETAIEPAAVV